MKYIKNIGKKKVEVVKMRVESQMRVYGARSSVWFLVKTSMFWVSRSEPYFLWPSLKTLSQGAAFLNLSPFVAQQQPSQYPAFANLSLGEKNLNSESRKSKLIRCCGFGLVSLGLWIWCIQYMTVFGIIKIYNNYCITDSAHAFMSVHCRQTNSFYSHLHAQNL